MEVNLHIQFLDNSSSNCHNITLEALPPIGTTILIDHYDNGENTKRRTVYGVIQHYHLYIEEVKQQVLHPNKSYTRFMMTVKESILDTEH